MKNDPDMRRTTSHKMTRRILDNLLYCSCVLLDRDDDIKDEKEKRRVIAKALGMAVTSVRKWDMAIKKDNPSFISYYTIKQANAKFGKDSPLYNMKVDKPKTSQDDCVRTPMTPERHSNILETRPERLITASRLRDIEMELAAAKGVKEISSHDIAQAFDLSIRTVEQWKHDISHHGPTRHVIVETYNRYLKNVAKYKAERKTMEQGQFDFAPVPDPSPVVAPVVAPVVDDDVTDIAELFTVKEMSMYSVEYWQDYTEGQLRDICSFIEEAVLIKRLEKINKQLVEIRELRESLSLS